MFILIQATFMIVVFVVNVAAVVMPLFGCVMLRCELLINVILLIVTQVSLKRTANVIHLTN